MKKRLHHESGEPIEEPIHPGQQRRIRRGQEIFSEDYLSSARGDQHTGWQCWPSSTRSSWWYSWKWAGARPAGHVVAFTGAADCNEVPGADEETKSHLQWQFLGIWEVLRGIILESLYVNTTQIRNKWDCRKSSAKSERRYVCGTVAIRSGWKMVVRFHGMLLLSVKYSG